MIDNGIQLDENVSKLNRELMQTVEQLNLEKQIMIDNGIQSDENVSKQNRELHLHPGGGKCSDAGRISVYNTGYVC